MTRDFWLAQPQAMAGELVDAAFGAVPVHQPAFVGQPFGDGVDRDRPGSKLGTVDFLVNNAGIQVSADSHELDPAAFNKVLAVNLRGSFLCAQQAIKALVDADRPGARSRRSAASSGRTPSAADKARSTSEHVGEHFVAMLPALARA